MGGKMARKKLGMALLATLTVLAVNAVAQSNQVAGIVGRSFISNQSVSGSGAKIYFGDGLSYEANFSHTFINLGIVGIGVEVPFVFNPVTNVSFAGANAVPKDFRAYYITPAARATLFPTTAFNPWVSVGGGVAHYSPNSTLQYGGPNPNTSSTNTGVFQVGIGLDVRILGPFKLRGEFRDFDSTEPPINLNTSKRGSHYFAGGGLVFAF
jgi:hypothetical protein